VWPTGSEDEWEYAAMYAAAASSSTLPRVPDESRRRCVIAVDAKEAVDLAEGEDPTLVQVADVELTRVASVHVDLTEGDSEDLAWFAVQELPTVVGSAGLD
jgi:hypothetical protein